MKYIRYAALLLALLLAFTLCGTFVLWVFDMLLDLSFGNLFYSGFQVGLVALLLLGAYEIIKRNKSK